MYIQKKLSFLTQLQQDDLDNSASQIFYKWSESIGSKIYMDIRSKRKSINGSMGVRIRKEERGVSTNFDTFLARLDCCKLTEFPVNDSDTATSESESEGKLCFLYFSEISSYFVVYTFTLLHR